MSLKNLKVQKRPRSSSGERNASATVTVTKRMLKIHQNCLLMGSALDP